LLEILLGEEGVPLDPRLPVHDAIRAVLQRGLRFAAPCRCSYPWLRVYVADTWRQGRLEVTQVQACCEAQRRAVELEMPAAMVGERPVVDPVPPDRPNRSSMRLLLDDCVLDNGEGLPDAVLVVPKEEAIERLSVCSRHDSMVVRCDFPFMVDGTSVGSLLLRPLYHSVPLREALREFRAVEVAVYWRRFGFEWTPGSLVAAERFGIGVGGSMTARLTRLFPDVMPAWPQGSLSTAAQGP
jgi:hypothetical protein